MKLLTAFLLLLMVFFSFSCKHKTEKQDTFTPSFTTYKNETASPNAPAPRNEIFYGTLTPIEICALFRRLDVPFTKEALNPVSNSSKYLSSSKVSINTGIYGVDLGYLKMFGMGQQMIDYVFTILDMTNKLGIPEKYIKEPIELMRGNNSDPDTLMKRMNDSYYKMENHLRKSGMESTAGLMVMAGWVEAMYISTQLVYNPEKPDTEVVQKIAEQKYSLATLLSFIKNYYDDPVVVYYSKKLKYLNNYFDSFRIYFKKGDLEIDTDRKVFRSTGSETDVSVETLNKIRDYILKLRTELVTP